MKPKPKKFTVQADQSSRLDKFLQLVLEEKSRTQVQRLIEAGMVKVDGNPIAKNSFKLVVGSEVEVKIPPKAPSSLVPEDLKLEIIYESEDLILINKPAGLVVHPSAGHQTGTLVHGVLAHDPAIEGVGDEVRPGVVHRLDKDTSGAILFAKNDKTHQALQAQFMARTVTKKYLAIVDGFPPTPSGRIDAAVGRDPKNRQKMAVVQDTQGKQALSQYKVLEQFENHCLIEIQIYTGRTHQIRLHLSFVGCPVVGDRLYGRMKQTTNAQRQMLHAWKIGFVEPQSNEEKLFTAELPDDFEEILSALRENRR